MQIFEVVEHTGIDLGDNSVVHHGYWSNEKDAVLYCELRPDHFGRKGRTWVADANGTLKYGGFTVKPHNVIESFDEETYQARMAARAEEVLAGMDAEDLAALRNAGYLNKGLPGTA